MKNNYRKLYNLLSQLNDIENKIAYNMYLNYEYKGKYGKDIEELIPIQNKLIKDIEEAIKKG